MAIVQDAVSELSSTAWQSGSSHTWSHTCSADATTLTVGFFHYNTTITSITYNGVALTQINSLTNGVDNLSNYFLANPASGANDIVVTLGASTAYNMGGAVSHEGADTTLPSNTTSIDEASQSSPHEITLTTVNTNSLHISLLRAGITLTGVTSGTTKLGAMWDSTGVNLVASSTTIATASANTVGVTHTGSVGQLGVSFELVEKKPDPTNQIKGSTLETNLVSYWDLEEASGTRYDLHGSNDLTDNNTVTQGTGKVGNCGNFVHANQECLSSTNNLFGGQAEVSGAMWIYPTAHGTYSDMYYGEYEATGNYRGLLFFRNNESPHNGLLEITVSGDGTTSNMQIYRTDQAECTTLNTWYHIAFVLDVVAETCTFYVNGSAVNSTKDSSVGSISTINSTASNTFYIGSWDDDGTYHYNDGRIDEAGIWHKELTSDEVSDLYGDAGAGLPYYDPAATDNALAWSNF